MDKGTWLKRTHTFNHVYLYELLLLSFKIEEDTQVLFLSEQATATDISRQI